MTGLEYEINLKSEGNWRLDPESNRDPRICNPLHSHSAIQPFNSLKNWCSLIQQ